MGPGAALVSCMAGPFGFWAAGWVGPVGWERASHPVPLAGWGCGWGRAVGAGPSGVPLSSGAPSRKGGRGRRRAGSFGVCHPTPGQVSLWGEVLGVSGGGSVGWVPVALPAPVAVSREDRPRLWAQGAAHHLWASRRRGAAGGRNFRAVGDTCQLLVTSSKAFQSPSPPRAGFLNSQRTLNLLNLGIWRHFKLHRRSTLEVPQKPGSLSGCVL